MVETIYALGDDAFANLFEMSFIPIPVLSEIQNALIRIQDISIPAISIDTYDVHYKTQMIQKPNGKISGVKEFSFNVRIDRAFLIYKMFVAWRNATQNVITGSIGSDNYLLNNRTDVTVWAVDSSGLPIPNFGSWTFKGAWPKTVGEVGFDYSSGDPIIVPITMGCLEMDDTLL